MKDSSFRRVSRLGFFVAVLAMLLALPASANAQKPAVRDAVSTFEYTQNMHPMGYSPFGNTPNLPGQSFTVSFTDCNGNQGDLVVYAPESSARGTSRAPIKARPIVRS